MRAGGFAGSACLSSWVACVGLSECGGHGWAFRSAVGGGSMRHLLPRAPGLIMVILHLVWPTRGYSTMSQA